MGIRPARGHLLAQRLRVGQVTHDTGPPEGGLAAWDVYDAVLDPGDVILMTSWDDEAAAEAHEQSVAAPGGSRSRRARVSATTV